jgi:hypothetical protein
MNRAEFENLISGIKTFFGVLLIVLFAVAVTSGDAFKGPDAFALRWTVISLAVAFSAVVAWLRWTSLQRRSAPCGPGRRGARRPFPINELVTADGGMLRPFENYPHDWRAVQICSGLVLERVGKPHRLPSTHALRHLSETDRDALVTRIKASLSESAEAGMRIPADVARRVRAGHALAVRTELRL